MAKTLMIQGTMSSAGKSYIVTGLCRYFSKLGFRVSPFKSQNMALNSYVTTEGLEIGRAQAVQAFACGKQPSVHMNPILLKPTNDVGSQIIVQGKPIGNMKAAEYFAYKKSLIPVIRESFDKLSAENDLIIVEGAGSPAEINLRENDIVNMGLAQMLDLPVLLVGDIDPGGVFAQLYGTINLLNKDEQNRIKGLIINKFRGDVSLLTPGLTLLEEKCNKPVVGVAPMIKVAIEEEDSITSVFSYKKDKDCDCDIVVIKLPMISNFTDFDAFKIMDGVSVRYVSKPSELGNPDLIIIPGTKATISDLRFLKDSGLYNCLLGFVKEIPLIGICGGYQMLGKSISDPDNIEGGGMEVGLGLINETTVLSREKTTKQVTGKFSGLSGVFSSLNGVTYTGYEIHNGRTDKDDIGKHPNVLGTYVHGIFDDKEVRLALINGILSTKGKCAKDSLSMTDYRISQFDILADSLAVNLNMKKISDIIGL